MTDSTDNKPKGERIAKALARAGVGSRRDVEAMILEGRVKLNNRKLDTPAVLVTSLDGIKVDGREVAMASETKLWRMHKERGTLTTHKDPQGRATVFDNMPEVMGRVIAVGRLDMNTEGLLLLTNDGELARHLELPDTGLVRTYKVRAHGTVTQAELDKLAEGVTIDGIHYGEIKARLESQQRSNAWLQVSITEGKNREVRRVMEHIGLEVNRLIRISYGPFTLGTLQRGSIAGVSTAQMYDLLPDFFADQKGSVAAPTRKMGDTSKWAKAKPKKSKPGDKRRNKFKADERRGTRGDGDKKSYADKRTRTGQRKVSDDDATRRPARRGISGGQGNYKPKKKRNPADDL